MNGLPPSLSGAEVLDRSPKGGNIILKVRTPKGPRVLKWFRRRRLALQEWFGEMCAVTAHRKRGVCMEARFHSEDRTHHAWQENGFGVLRRFDDPLPEGIGRRAIWYEHVKGPLLSSFLVSGAVSRNRKTEAMERLGRETGRRHRLCLEKKEAGLLQEHSTIKHVFLQDDRLITFDFEASFRKNFVLTEGMTEEVSGLLRSLAKGTEDRFGLFLEAWISGYGDRSLLKEIARRGIEGKSVRRLFKRWADRRRRPDHSKVSLLEELSARSKE